MHPSKSKAPLPLLVAQARDGLRHQPQPILSRLGAIAAQRCPACLVGPLFRSSWRMYDKCPGCGHYHVSPTGMTRVAMAGFCGALTLALGISALAAMLYTAHALAPSQLGHEPAALGALGLEMLVVPRFYRHARALWEHITLPTRPQDP